MKQVTSEEFDQMLGAVPPILWDGRSFLVGEAYDADPDTYENRYMAYSVYSGEKGEEYFCFGPMTMHGMKTFEFSEKILEFKKDSIANAV